MGYAQLPSLPEPLFNFTFDGHGLDSSSNQNHGRIINCDFVEDRSGSSGKALYMYGDSDLFVMPQAKSLAKAGWTYTLWLNIHEYPSEHSDFFLLSQRDVEFGGDVPLFIDDYGKALKVFSNFHFDKPDSSYELELNRWYFVALIYDEGRMARIYLDQQLVTSFQADFTTDSGDSLVISSNFEPDPQKGRMHGALDDVCFFDSVLDHDQLYVLQYKGQEVPEIIPDEYCEYKLNPGNLLFKQNLQVESSCELQSTEVYNALGQLVHYSIESNNTIDSQNWATGAYFVKSTGNQNIFQNTIMVLN